jgi:hypothetical protein
MSDINDLGFGQQDDENGKAFYLDYSHSQIERLLDKIAAGYVFSEAQFNKLIKEIGLDNISTFDGKYASLEGKPAIPSKMSELENDSLYQTQENLNAKILALRESLVSEVKSAYDIACDHGFEGSEEEWLASLKGETGPKGDQGIQGEVGPEGPAGVAYDDTELRGRIEAIEELDIQEGPKGDQGEKGEDGVSIVDVKLENNHLMVTLSNDDVIDAGEIEVIVEGGGGSSADSEEVQALKDEVVYLQSEIDHMMMQIADDTYGVVYEWVYHFNLDNGESSINVAHVKELWDDVEAMGIDPFIDAIYEEDSYRLYVLRCASDYKYMNRYEVIPVDGNPMQQIGAIANWDPVKDITCWTFEGDIEKPVIDLDGAPTSDMIIALLKVKK